MENKAHAMAAGIFVLALCALLIGLAAWLTRDSGVRDPYEISTRETLTGLQAQAPVRFRGVDVGKVITIGFDPLTPGNVLIRMEIARQTPVSTETFASLGFQGVTGLSFVQLDDSGKPGQTLVAAVAGTAPRIPLRQGFFGNLQVQGEALLGQLERFVVRANRLLDDDNQRRFSSSLDNLGQAAGSVGSLARHLDTTLGQRLDPLLVETQTTLRGVQKAASDVGQAASGFERTAQRLNQPDGPVERLSVGAQALSQAVQTVNATTLPGINRVTDESSRAVRAINRAATSLNDNPQSLIFGSGTVPPGPGEPGFVAPGGSR